MKIRCIVQNIEVQVAQNVGGASKATLVFDEQRGIVYKTNKAFTEIIDAMGHIHGQMETMNESISKMDEYSNTLTKNVNSLQEVIETFKID